LGQWSRPADLLMRGCAEFAPGDDADILVSHESVNLHGRDSLIELVELRGELGEVAAVSVPTAEGEGDARTLLRPASRRGTGPSNGVRRLRRRRGRTAGRTISAWILAFEIERSASLLE
jgi:hypothetical protein